ncbi:hypothetical protein F5B20DRAFT_586280 [Whalleya microplaca]|nr:hypothetical protein F5B20DRAFT_586280 [Whalleya microplaca]
MEAANYYKIAFGGHETSNSKFSAKADELKDAHRQLKDRLERIEDLLPSLLNRASVIDSLESKLKHIPSKSHQRLLPLISTLRPTMNIGNDGNHGFKSSQPLDRASTADMSLQRNRRTALDLPRIKTPPAKIPQQTFESFRPEDPTKSCEFNMCGFGGQSPVDPSYVEHKIGVYDPLNPTKTCELEGCTVHQLERRIYTIYPHENTLLRDTKGSMHIEPTKADRCLPNTHSHTCENSVGNVKSSMPSTTTSGNHESLTKQHDEEVSGITSDSTSDPGSLNNEVFISYPTSCPVVTSYTDDVFGGNEGVLIDLSLEKPYRTMEEELVSSYTEITQEACELNTDNISRPSSTISKVPDGPASKLFRPSPTYILSVAEQIAKVGPYIPPNEDYIDVLFPNEQDRLAALAHHNSQMTQRNINNPPQVFKYGCQYLPNPYKCISDEMKGADYECRSVIISGLEPATPIRDILSKVRGGNILRISTATSQLGYTAMVQFVNWREAHAYSNFIRRHGLSLYSPDLSVKLANSPSYPIDLETQQDISHGFTRCLAILNFSLSPAKFLEGFKAWYRWPDEVFEDVWVDDKSTLYVLFKDIAYASRYYKAVAGGYHSPGIKDELFFTNDPCAGPLEELHRPACLARGQYQSVMGA